MTKNNLHPVFQDALRGFIPPRLEMIDWSERFPQESSRTIAIRQSTYCCCGASDCRKSKQIGVMTCKG